MNALKLILIALAIVGIVIYVIWPRCLVEGTLVDTPLGPRSIEDLEVGDVVWSSSPSGTITPGTVQSVERHFVLAYSRVTLKDGASLDVTGSHPLRSARGWVAAGTLSADDTLVGIDGTVVPASIETVLAPAAVYDISVFPHANFFAEGVLVHNKSVRTGAGEAIGDTRAVISALHTFAAANCGVFPDSLADVTRDDGTPISIPNYPDDAPQFLAADLGRNSPYVKDAFERRYQVFGRPEIDETQASRCDLEGGTRFCYASRPTGAPLRASPLPDWLPQWFVQEPIAVRSFVGTSDGRIYVDVQGRDLSCVDGEPPEFAQTLQ
jgi:hypothetical protein